MNRFNGPAVQSKTNPQKMGTEMACSHSKVNLPSATPSSLSTTTEKKNPKVTGCCEKAVHLQSKVIIWMTLSGLKIADARTTLPVRLSVNSAMRSNQNKKQKFSHRGFRLVIYGYCWKLLFTKFKTLNKIMLPRAKGLHFPNGSRGDSEGRKGTCCELIKTFPPGEDRRSPESSMWEGLGREWKRRTARVFCRNEDFISQRKKCAMHVCNICCLFRLSFPIPTVSSSIIRLEL